MALDLHPYSNETSKKIYLKNTSIFPFVDQTVVPCGLALSRQSDGDYLGFQAGTSLSFI